MLVVGNWKCNPDNLTKAQELFNLIQKGIKPSENIEVIICPPFVWLIGLKMEAKGFKLGAQDCFWATKGAFTGEISPTMLKNLGCQYVILGHSERRIYLGETNEMIAKKLKTALEVGLKPILCIGETLKERQQNKVNEALKKQLAILKNQNLRSNIQNLILAYEPVWAIGTAKPCDPKDAKEVLQILKCNEFVPSYIPVIYGGSVNSQNAKEYIKAGFQGLLIGGSSLNSKEFIKIIKTLEKITPN